MSILIPLRRRIIPREVEFYSYPDREHLSLDVVVDIDPVGAHMRMLVGKLYSMFAEPAINPKLGVEAKTLWCSNGQTFTANNHLMLSKKMRGHDGYFTEPYLAAHLITLTDALQDCAESNPGVSVLLPYLNMRENNLYMYGTAGLTEINLNG